MLEKILITTGISLVVINFYRIKKEQKKSFNNALEVEQLNRINTKDFEIELLNDELEKLKRKVDKINKNNIKENNANDNNIDIDKSKENKTLANSNSKKDKIKTLLDLGYSDEEICKELNLGKGELQLIKKIYN